MFIKYKKTKNLRTMVLDNSNRKRTKLIALIMLVIMLITITTSGVGAVTSDISSSGSSLSDIGETIKSVYSFDDSVLEDFRTHENIQRSAKRTYIFYDTYDLIKTYNSRNKNVIKWLNTMSSDDSNSNTSINKEKASDLYNKWYSLYINLRDLYDTVRRSCFTSDSGGKVKWQEYKNGAYYDTDDVISNSDYNNIRKNINSYSSTLNSLYSDFKDAYNQRKDNNVSSMNSYTSNMVTGQYSIVTYLWKELGKTLKDFGNGNARKGSNFFGISWGTNSMKKIANVVAPVTKSFAYCLVVILFGLNMTNTMLQFDFTSQRGIIKVLVSLIISKIWVDLSVRVCSYIINIVNSMNSQLLKLLKVNVYGVVYTSSFEPSTARASSWNFLGTIIGFFQNIFLRGPELILIIALGFAIISVFIKILSRAFELTCLMAISPLAFACVANEETKVYFKKFIGAFLSTCLFMTFMIICYMIGSQWIAEANNGTAYTGSSFITNLKQVIPKFVIIFGICRIMAKPPKALTNLID